MVQLHNISAAVSTAGFDETVLDTSYRHTQHPVNHLYNSWSLIDFTLGTAVKIWLHS